MTKNSKQRKKVMLPVDPQLAKEIQQLSASSGSSPQNILAALVWIGKKAFGRKVKIEGDNENMRLSITSFEDFPKLSPIDEE
jgi:hypothetical protein